MASFDTYHDNTVAILRDPATGPANRRAILENMSRLLDREAEGAPDARP